MIAGIVLAAGRSRRMGRSKSMLPLDGRVFLEWTIMALRRGGCDAIRVVVSDASDPASVTVAEGLGATVIRNPDARSEQIDSLRAGLRALPREAEAAIVLPVDVPRASPEDVSALIDAFDRTSAPVVVPVRAGRHGHPVLFGRSVWPELLAGDLPEGARTVVHTHAADRIEVPVSALPEDVDTPEDYERLVGR